MNAKRLLLAVLVSAAMIVIARADDREQRSPANSARTDRDVTRIDAQAGKEAAAGEQVQPVFEPGITAIEESYRQQMQSLKLQMQSASTEDDREHLQQQAQALKVEWTLALANRQLELARERQDAAAETELLQAIDRIQHPAAPAATPVARDPQAGITVEGGAR